MLLFQLRNLICLQPKNQRSCKIGDATRVRLSTGVPVNPLRCDVENETGGTKRCVIIPSLQVPSPPSPGPVSILQAPSPPSTQLDARIEGKAKKSQAKTPKAKQAKSK